MTIVSMGFVGQPAKYTDIKSDGGMDPRNRPGGYEKHRKLFMKDHLLERSPQPQCGNIGKKESCIEPKGHEDAHFGGRYIWPNYNREK